MKLETFQHQNSKERKNKDFFSIVLIYCIILDESLPVCVSVNSPHKPLSLQCHMASVQKMTTPTGAQRFAVTSDSPCPSPLSTNTVLAGRFLVGCKYIPAVIPVPLLGCLITSFSCSRWGFRRMVRSRFKRFWVDSSVCTFPRLTDTLLIRILKQRIVEQCLVCAFL